MSREASAWARKTRGHRNRTQKEVLMVLGELYQEKWGFAWASYNSLADDCEMSKRNLIRHLKNLVEDGYIELQKGRQHVATKFRLCMERDFTAAPAPITTRRRKTLLLQLALEGGSQDFLRGDIPDTPGYDPEVSTAAPLNPSRGDNQSNSEVTTVVSRGDNGGKALCLNHAHQPGTNRVNVNPETNSPGLKKRNPEYIDKPQLQPGEIVSFQPGGIGGCNDGQYSSVPSGVTVQVVSETVSENIGPAPPDPYDAYRQNIGPLAPILEAMIWAAEERYGAASIVEAIGIAVMQNSPRWSYVDGILRKWASEGRGALGESTDQRNNRAKYVEDSYHRYAQNPWDSPDPAESQEQPGQVSIENAPEAAQIWTRVLEALAVNVDKPIFSTWLADTLGIGFDDERFVIEVPTPFAIAWLERRMYQTIQNTVGDLAGKVFDIQFQVREQP